MDPEKPSANAQETDLPASQTSSPSLPAAESTKPAEGSTPAAIPDSKQADLEKRKEDSAEGRLRILGKERGADKKVIQTLTERLDATEKDLNEALEALSKTQVVEPLQEEETPRPGARPNALAGILDRRRQREAETKAKETTGNTSATVRFVALVEGAGLDLNDPRLAEAKAAATPEEGIEVAKKILKDIRETERKGNDDRFNLLSGQVKELKEGMLRVDTSGPSGGAIPQGTPYDLAVAAYSSSNKPKRS